MLVLQRHPGQQILIGDDIIITVMRSPNDQIKIGIDAPRYVPVLRSELTWARDIHRKEVGHA